MAFNRRQALGLLGGAISSPYVLKSAEAFPDDYQPIGTVHGDDMFIIPGCDATVHIGGFVVGWANGPVGGSFAYMRNFQFDGHPTSPVTQLGRPSGPTDGTNANLVTLQSRPNGSGVAFFSAPKIGLSDRIVWSNGFRASGAEIGAPVQVSNAAVTGDYIQGLFSTTLSNGNLATAYTYFDNASEVDARVRVCNPNGAPLFHERIFSASSSFVFANNLCAGKNALFFGRTTVGSGGNQHWAEHLSPAGVAALLPFEIKPPAGQFINGTPSLLPGPNDDLYSVFLAGTAGKDNFDLCLQHFDNKGKRGRIIKVGSQESDNFGLIGNYPRCVTTPKGNLLAFSDAPEEIVAWHFLKTGKLLSRRAFRRKRRQMRMQQLRRIGATFVALWTETNLANSTTQWFAEAFNLLNEI